MSHIHSAIIFPSTIITQLNALATWKTGLEQLLHIVGKLSSTFFSLPPKMFHNDTDEFCCFSSNTLTLFKFRVCIKSSKCDIDGMTIIFRQSIVYKIWFCRTRPCQKSGVLSDWPLHHIQSPIATLLVRWSLSPHRCNYWAPQVPSYAHWSLYTFYTSLQPCPSDLASFLWLSLLLILHDVHIGAICISDPLGNCRL